jgi:protein-S-isoprenylcysteine O-methyltransferase Ste14
MTRTSAILGTIVFTIAMPVTVAGMVPWLISKWRFHDPLFGVEATRIVGLVLCFPGMIVLLESIARFAWKGRGTPAPVAPTAHLVVTGFYRFVRNPMYVAVVSLVLGQALFFANTYLALYGAILWIVFHVFVTRYEEPTLRRQFGTAYDAFRTHVPRWLPRLKPWRGGEAQR